MAFPSLRVPDSARRATFAAFASVFILAAGWQAFGQGQAVNGDGISYLDLAVQYSHGDFSAIRNGYWSPLYPALLGLLFRLGATPATELVVVYGTNVVLATMAMLAFAWMLREMEWSRPATRTPLRPEIRAGTWVLFAWYMLRMLGVHTITPDGMVGIYLFVSAALLARQISGRAMPQDPLWLGFVIGIGYLAKAVLLPVGILLGATYTALSWRSRRRAATVTRILLPAAVLAAPLLTVQSLAQGRLSFGETGRINYAWFVAAEPLSAEDHATRSAPRPGLAMRLDVADGALVWPDSNAGTYAFWYDPSRWTPQWHPRLDVARQLAVLRQNVRWLRLLAWVPAIVIIALLALGLSHRARVRRDLLPLAVAPGALLVLYLAIHAEARLAGAAIIVLLVLALALPQYVAPFHTAMLRGALVGLMALFVVRDTMPKLRRVHLDPRAITDTRLADAVRRIGLAGAEVALIGDPDGHYWAHAARLRIVAELPADRVYTNDDLAGAIRQARTTGRDIRAVLVSGSGISGPTIALADGWHAWLPHQWGR